MSGRRVAALADECAQEFAEVGTRLERHFARPEPRQRAGALVRTLLSDVERQNGWQNAERLGDANPYAVQHLLGRATWSADAVRDELQGYVAERLGDADAALIVDETGFLKKGTKSAGVARQYSGTAGRIENGQVGVFLAYASRHGAALVDRELYLPKEWAGDAARRKAAGVPKDVGFATKIALAQRMIARAMTNGLPAPWVAADAVYGSDSRFRLAVEELGLGYVVAVRSDFAAWIGFRQVRVRKLLEELPAEAWQRRSCGAGSKGPRVYDWALRPVNAPEPRRRGRWLLFRRGVADPREVACFACGAKPRTKLDEFVRIAGRRWAIEERFELAKGDCGLDEHEVRSWTGWRRHVTLSLWALAIAVAVRALAARRPRKKGARASCA